MRDRRTVTSRRERYIDDLEIKVDEVERECEKLKRRVEDMEEELRHIDDERPRKDARSNDRNRRRKDEEETSTMDECEQLESGGGRPVVRLPVRKQKPLEERISTNTMTPKAIFSYRPDDVPKGREHGRYLGCGYQPRGASIWPPQFREDDGLRIPPKNGFEQRTREDARNTKAIPTTFRELNVTNESTITHLSDIARTEFHSQNIPANLILQELRARVTEDPSAKPHPLEYYILKYYRGIPPWLKWMWPTKKEDYYETIETSDTDIPIVEFDQPGLPSLEVSETERWIAAISRGVSVQIPGISKEMVEEGSGEETLMGALIMAEWMPLGKVCRGLEMLLEVLAGGATSELVVVEEHDLAKTRIPTSALMDRGTLKTFISQIRVTEDEKEYVRQWAATYTNPEAEEIDEEMM